MKEALNPRHPELVALAQGARNSAREAAIFAAQTALQRTPVSDHPVPEALSALRRQDWVTPFRLVPQLEALVQRLDSLYWDISDESGAKETPAARDAFARARAVNALVAAMALNPVVAAVDAIYEAQASLPDGEVDSFLESAKAILRKLQVEK